MNKNDCIDELRQCLKGLGYNKNGNYWYRRENDIQHCVCVIGSQWNKTDYYVEIGIAMLSSAGKCPTIGNWDLRSPCWNDEGQNQNPEPADVLRTINTLEVIHTSEDMLTYLSSHPYVKLGKQLSML